MRKIGKFVFSDGNEKIETEILYDGKKLSVDLSEIRKFLFKYDGNSNIIFDIALDIANSFRNIGNVKFNNEYVHCILPKNELKKISNRKFFKRNELYSLLISFKNL